MKAQLIAHRVRSSLAGLLIWGSLLGGLVPPTHGAGTDTDRIQPWPENSFYWQYEGQPVLLLGGTYQWNDEYWRRFDNFLKLTHERDIIVQIEIWATWDHYEDHQTIGGWSKHPFNPVNNVNYTAAGSGLPVAIDYGAAPTPTGHKFFHTVPALENNTVVLPYQQAYVDKLLSYSLKYPHVLYCMNNETGEPVEWSDYWARYVRDQAAAAGKTVETAEMRRSGNITTPDHRHMIEHPELYTFLDISQNNTQRGQIHWDRIQQVRAWVKDRPRPINNNKIYTFDSDPNVALERWWRNILGGCASARFHRPHPLEGEGDHEMASNVGLGLSPLAQAHIRSSRTLMEEIGWPDVEPDLGFVKLTMDAPLVVRTEKTHVAYTRDADGRARLYVNGKEAAAAQIDGALSAWDPQMRLRTSATSANGLPAVQVGGNSEASIAALRSLNRDRAAIFVTHGGLLKVDMAQLQQGLETHWFDPFTGDRQKAAPRPDGSFQPPSREIWLLVLHPRK